MPIFSPKIGAEIAQEIQKEHPEWAKKPSDDPEPKK